MFQFFGGVAFGQQRGAKTGLDQPLLRGQAVDRRPVDFAKAMGLKQRKYMRGCDLATPRQHRKRDPAFTAQIGELGDTAAGARMIRRADHLQLFGEQQVESRSRER